MDERRKRERLIKLFLVGFAKTVFTVFLVIAFAFAMFKVVGLLIGTNSGTGSNVPTHTSAPTTEPEEDITGDDEVPTEDAAAQIATTEPISSKGLKIVILNSTEVQGLAKKWKDKLVQAEFSISDVGNFTGSKLEKTKIIVKTEGMGADLQTYFSDAVIEVGTVQEGSDINVIIGTADVLE